MIIERPNWDQYFLDIAHIVASRSTCPRSLSMGGVGAVLVDNNNHHILGTGYAASPKGVPHCIDIGCEMVNNSCIRTIHAEINALLHSQSTSNPKTLYTTLSPCWDCWKALISAGVSKVIFATRYKIIERQISSAESLGIELKQVCRDWAPEEYK